MQFLCFAVPAPPPSVQALEPLSVAIYLDLLAALASEATPPAPSPGVSEDADIAPAEPAARPNADKVRKPAAGRTEATKGEEGMIFTTMGSAQDTDDVGHSMQGSEYLSEPRPLCLAPPSTSPCPGV